MSTKSLVSRRTRTNLQVLLSESNPKLNKKIDTCSALAKKWIPLKKWLSPVQKASSPELTKDINFWPQMLELAQMCRWRKYNKLH